VAEVTRRDGGEKAGSTGRLWARLTVYWRETRSELRKVVWPTREQAINLTVVVLVVVLAMTILLGGLDLLFTQMVEFLVGLS
jgi:preprotein translocase subunit SecE